LLFNLLAVQAGRRDITDPVDPGQAGFQVAERLASRHAFLIATTRRRWALTSPMQMTPVIAAALHNYSQQIIRDVQRQESNYCSHSRDPYWR
jgi:hypothetical protein